MNLSLKWLADYVDCGVSAKDFCAGMTMSGSKVETYETEGAEVKNVIVGKLLSIAPHENSDHLQVCQVDVGSGAPIQIVTGAQNIVEGALVPVAMIGADLPGGVHIKKADQARLTLCHRGRHLPHRGGLQAGTGHPRGNRSE